MEIDLSKKNAIVTGASRGIGKAIAHALHRAGATVVITGRDKKTLETAAKEIGDTCHPIVCDHRNPASIQSMADRTLNLFGAPDIIVNNAGTFARGDVANLPLKNWEDVISTNLTGTFLTTKAFLPEMINKNRGDIIMIGSTSGKKGDPGSSAYAASKFGLQGFTQALMYEVRRHNIRVMMLNPSYVNKSEDTGPKEGHGITLHANDIAETIVHMISLPGRTLIREIEIWATNP